jgi:hypothetical protein
MVFKIFLRLMSLTSLFGSGAVAAYTIHAIVIGEVKVASRRAGTSIFRLDEQPAFFFGCVAFYIICALAFLFIGYRSMAKK